MSIWTIITLGAGIISSLTIIVTAIIAASKTVREWAIKKVGAVALEEAKAQDSKLVDKIDKKLDVLVEPVQDLKGTIQCLQNELNRVELNVTLLCGANREQLKNFIKNIYYANLDSKTIGEYDKEILIEFYHLYKELGGNHLIDVIVKDIMEWEVVKEIG